MEFADAWSAAKLAVERDKVRALGDLYFVRAGDAVKIGRTINIVNRLGKMQADNHEELCCLLVVAGRGIDEPIWHEAFRDTCRRGEWFDWSAELGSAIESARRGEDWWEGVFAPFDYIAERAEPDDEEAIWAAVYQWRDEVTAQIERNTERLAA